MKFPLDNKESLPINQTINVSRLKYRSIIIVSIISLASTIVSVVTPTVKEIVLSDKSKMMLKKEQEEKYNHFIDSIREKEQIIQSNQLRNPR